MKFSLSAFASILLVTQVVSLPTEVEEHAELAPPRNCRRPGRAVPLLHSWNPDNTDHFYTTNNNEMQNAVRNLGYRAEGNAGRVFPDAGRLTTPLYRLWSASATDHFYTTSANERDNAVRRFGYTAEGITGYVYENQICGSIPLFRLWNPQITDHFYTTNWEERQNAVDRLGYQAEGVAGYVLP